MKIPPPTPPRWHARVFQAAVALVALERAGDDWSLARQRVRESLPGRCEQWSLLLDALSAQGSVIEPSPGRIVVRLGREGEQETGNGDEVTVLITPDQWEEVLGKNAGDLSR